MINKLIAYLGLALYVVITPRLLSSIWPEDIENYSYFYIFCLEFAHLSTYIFVNLYYFAIYYLEMPAFEKYKVEARPWPWKEDKAFWKELRNRTLTNFIINQFIGVLLAFLQSLFTRARFDTHSIPTVLEISWQIIFFAFVEDIFFYFSHRLLHHPALYPYIHKQHHLYKVTISISAEFAHPLEYIFGNLVPVFAGATLLGSHVHLITLMTWIGIAIHKTLSDHSGYQFPWEVYHYLPASTNSDFHSYHHSANIGNYSSTFTYLDTFFGTSKSYDEMKAAQKRK